MDATRNPVIVGVGQVNDRPDDLAVALDPVALAEAALRRADADGGARGLAGQQPHQAGGCGTGGAEGSRTPDLCSAIAALSQLSYGPAPGAISRAASAMQAPGTAPSPACLSFS